MEKFLVGCMGFIALAFIPLLLLGGIIYEVAAYNHVTTVKGEVVDKYTKRGSESDKFYIVVREEDGTEKVLKNEDSLFMWKFDSAEVQAKVHKGESYEIKLRGYRVPFLSAFPNVDSTKALK
ncbi:DUF1523 family protein [Bacillus cereus]|uniref:DUF1523 family protein n=1 Tax=Bacillus cereus TaxID=1396 RepID=UPI0035CAFD5F